MKKIFTLLCMAVFCLFSSWAWAAEAPAPTQKIVLFYQVPETIITHYIKKSDRAMAFATFEEQLNKEYSKRFLVEDIRQVPQETQSLSDYRKLIAPDQLPLIVTFNPVTQYLSGQAAMTAATANAIATLLTGVSSANEYKTNLVESFPNLDDDCFYDYDYGVTTHTASAGSRYSSPESPSKATKKLVAETIHRACKLRSYDDPIKSQKELDRFVGNFKAKHFEELANTQLIKDFEAWCHEDPTDKDRAKMLKYFYIQGDKARQVHYINKKIEKGQYTPPASTQANNAK